MRPPGSPRARRAARRPPLQPRRGRRPTTERGARRLPRGARARRETTSRTARRSSAPEVSATARPDACARSSCVRRLRLRAPSSTTDDAPRSSAYRRRSEPSTSWTARALGSPSSPPSPSPSIALSNTPQPGGSFSGSHPSERAPFEDSSSLSASKTSVTRSWRPRPSWNALVSSAKSPHGGGASGLHSASTAARNTREIDVEPSLAPAKCAITRPAFGSSRRTRVTPARKVDLPWPDGASSNAGSLRPRAAWSTARTWR